MKTGASITRPSQCEATQEESTLLEPQEILEKLSQYLVLLFSLSVHESAHAWTALHMGDETGMREGRISLNPIVHIDPLGTVLFPLIGLFAGGVLFGWAKPVPVQPRYFRRIREGQIATAGAGPLSNFLLAVLFTGAYAATTQVLGLEYDHPLVLIAKWGIVLNVILGVFNLVPVPPLDGSHLASWGLPRSLGDVYDRMMTPYGFMILMLLLVSGALSVVFDLFAWPIVDLLVRLGGGA